MNNSCPFVAIRVKKPITQVILSTPNYKQNSFKQQYGIKKDQKQQPPKK